MAEKRTSLGFQLVQNQDHAIITKAGWILQVFQLKDFDSIFFEVLAQAMASVRQPMSESSTWQLFFQWETSHIHVRAVQSMRSCQLTVVFDTTQKNLKRAHELQLLTGHQLV